MVTPWTSRVQIPAMRKWRPLPGVLPLCYYTRVLDQQELMCLTDLLSLEQNLLHLLALLSKLFLLASDKNLLNLNQEPKLFILGFMLLLFTVSKIKDLIKNSKHRYYIFLKIDTQDWWKMKYFVHVKISCGDSNNFCSKLKGYIFRPINFFRKCLLLPLNYFFIKLQMWNFLPRWRILNIGNFFGRLLKIFQDYHFSTLISVYLKKHRLHAFDFYSFNHQFVKHCQSW